MKNIVVEGHRGWAVVEFDVRLCIGRGADLITANELRPLLKVLGRL